MQNMYSILSKEGEITQEERDYSIFCLDLNDILLCRDFNRDGIAWDLFRDGCSPQEAADEMIARNEF